MTTEQKDEMKAAYWWEAEKKRSARLNHSRKTAWSKDCISNDYLPGIMAGLDKMYWYTKVYSETEGEPLVLRRAKALNATLENQPIFVQDQAQLVGYTSARPNEVVLQPEINDNVLWDVFHDRREYVAERDREWYEHATENYWSKHSFREQMDRDWSKSHRLHSFSQGWMQSRPQMPGSGLPFLTSSTASSSRPRAMSPR